MGRAYFDGTAEAKRGQGRVSRGAEPGDGRRSDAGPGRDPTRGQERGSSPHRGDDRVAGTPARADAEGVPATRR